MRQPVAARTDYRDLCTPCPRPFFRSRTLVRVALHARPQAHRQGTSTPPQAGNTMRDPGGR